MPAASRSSGLPGLRGVHGQRGARRSAVRRPAPARARPRPAGGPRRRCRPRPGRAAPRPSRRRCRTRSGSTTSARRPRRRRPPRRWEVVVVVSSSRPSSPRNTQASTPRRANTPAISGAIRRVGAADRLGRGPGRVGQRAEEVEGRGDAELARAATAACRSAGWNAAAKQKVIPTSSPTRATSAAGRSSRMPSCLEHVGRAGLGRGRPVAVLDHRRAGAGGDDRGHRRDVHRHRPVAAGADDVEHPAARRRAGWRASYIAVDEPLELVDGLALGAQRDGEAGDLGRAWPRPARISPIAQAVWSGGQVRAADQGGEHLGPGVRGGHRSVAIGRLPRRRSARRGRGAAGRTVSAELQRVDRVRHGGVGARPGGQPGVLRPAGQHQRSAGTGRSRP